VSLARLHFNAGANEVVYVPKVGHNGSEPEQERIDAMEFVARVLMQIPDRFFQQSADGSAEPEPLPTEGPFEKHPGSMTPDGRSLLFSLREGSAPGLALLEIGGTTPARPILVGKQSEDMPALSPDGRWLAYDSAESGRWEVYLRRYPDMGGRLQVSTAGGRYPRWTRDGRSLFFMAGNRVYSARLEAAASPRVAAPRLFAEIDGLSGFDVMPDGSEVVALARLPDSGFVRQLQLVVDWPAELARGARAR
jgi:serine/threonine-protein kinase